MTALAIILGALVFLNVAGFIVTKAAFSHELDGIAPYGRLVDVSGRSMHVYSMGEGGRVVVLLPGFGVPLPCADLGPLMRELSKEHTAVCVEYFGVGFSDETDAPRTNENFVEEVRAALAGAGFRPPYVLMPHSGSGIYAEYYAAKYPEEVAAVVLLDTTSSAQAQPEVPKFVYGIGKLQQATGLSRIVNAFVVPSLLKEKNGYTRKEIDDYGKFINHAGNDALIDQFSRLNDNIREVMKMDFPGGVPVLKLIASRTARRVGGKYQADHLRRLGASARAVTLPGAHLIYQANARAVCAAAAAFLREHCPPERGASGRLLDRQHS